MIKQGTILTIFVFGLLSCHKPDKEISQTVQLFFQNYHSDFRKINKVFLSKSLAELIRKTQAKEMAEITKVAQSKSPTDKPFIIDGDIFRSMDEGQTVLKILDIKKGGDSSMVLIAFENKQFKPIWKEHLVLVNENGWKIDNVIFDGDNEDFKPDTMNIITTKSVLLLFLNTKMQSNVIEV